MTRFPLKARFLPDGFATIPVLVVLLVVITLLMTNTLSTTAVKVTDDVEQHDTAQAFFLAESGLDLAMSALNAAAVVSPIKSLENVREVCDGLESAVSLSASGLAVGPGVVTLKLLSRAPNPLPIELVELTCDFEAVGKVRNATRTLRKSVTFKPKQGVAGFGGSGDPGLAKIEASILNNRGVSGFAVFNLAWRRVGSFSVDPNTGTFYPASDGQAIGEPCLTNVSCGLVYAWRTFSSGGGSVSTGSFGSVLPIASGPDPVGVAQRLVAQGNSNAVNRDFVQVGLVLTGTKNGPSMLKRGALDSPAIQVNNSTPINVLDIPNGSLQDAAPPVASGPGLQESGTISFPAPTGGKGPALTTTKLVSGTGTKFTKADIGKTIYVAKNGSNNNEIGKIASYKKADEVELVNPTAVDTTQRNFFFGALGYSHPAGGVTCTDCDNWCYRSDTLVFGVSGRADPNALNAESPPKFAGGLISIKFGSAPLITEITGPPKKQGPIATFPSPDFPSPPATGDLFSQLWAYYNPFLMVRVTGLSGGNTVVQFSSSDAVTSVDFNASDFTDLNLKGTAVSGFKNSLVTPGTTVDLSDGAVTYNASSGVGTIKLTKAVDPSIVGQIICGGICAYFDQTKPTTPFEVVRDPNLVTQFSGGFACFRNTDREQIEGIPSGAQATAVQWREVVR